jgi:hypothetical protein
VQPLPLSESRLQRRQCRLLHWGIPFATPQHDGSLANPCRELLHIGITINLIERPLVSLVLGRVEQQFAQRLRDLGSCPLVAAGKTGEKGMVDGCVLMIPLQVF